MRRIAPLLAVLVLGCAADDDAITCGASSCEEAIPAVPSGDDTCEGSDWQDDGGGDDELRTAPMLEPLVPADGDLQAGDLYPAGDVDVYQWPMAAMSTDPIELAVESMDGNSSALDLCARITTDGSTGTIARCTRGEERLIGDDIHCCTKPDGQDRSVLLVPAGEPQSTGVLEAQVALGVGGHCDRYALTVTTIER